ncbi:hypothetical protein BS78_04G174700 [Paspalum vaginatum]|nr:hypothetical protein BS78_04G174700 [Paspalum vaginatum]
MHATGDVSPPPPALGGWLFVLGAVNSTAESSSPTGASQCDACRAVNTQHTQQTQHTIHGKPGTGRGRPWRGRDPAGPPPPIPPPEPKRNKPRAVLSCGLTTTGPSPIRPASCPSAPHSARRPRPTGHARPPPLPPPPRVSQAELPETLPPAASASAAAMDPASEELERRSRYLSSLIRRTKLSAAPAPAPAPPPPQPEPEVAAPEPEPEPEPEAAVVKREAAKAASTLSVEEKEKREVIREEERGDGKGKEVGGKDDGAGRKVSVRVRAADMPLPLQRRAIRLAYEAIAAMPRLDSKRLALALKQEFDKAYGPAWHCIVGTSFGSYVTHSLGGFLYFSVDKAYILLFRTAVEPLGHPR